MTALEMFRNRLAKNHKERSKWAKKQNISCYRLYEEDIPQVPLVIEKYENCYVLWDRSSAKYQTQNQEQDRIQKLEKIVLQVLSLSPSALFSKRREKQKGNKQYSKLSMKSFLLQARERDCIFELNLSDYLDTGLFLDHRITREVVARSSANKRVLNLFSYTGSFTVAAKKGGASHITQVEWNPRTLDWALRNLELNGFSGRSVESIEGDVRDYLEECYGKKKGRPYDLIILDPPTFSNSKRSNRIWSVEKNLPPLLDFLAENCMHEDSILLFSTNYRKFHWDEQRLKSRLHALDCTEISLPKDFRQPGKRKLFEIRLKPFGKESSIFACLQGKNTT